MNSFTASGYVKRPESKVTTTGKNLLKFALAIPNPRKEGAEKATYTYCNCQLWGDAPSLEEGAEVLCHGRFYSSSYVKKDGSKGNDTGMVVDKLAVIRNGKAGRLVQGEQPPMTDDMGIPF